MLICFCGKLYKSQMKNQRGKILLNRETLRILCLVSYFTKASNILNFHSYNYLQRFSLNQRLAHRDAVFSAMQKFLLSTMPGRHKQPKVVKVVNNRQMWVNSLGNNVLRFGSRISMTS